MRRALTIAWRETRDIVRERTIVMALLTQLFVAAFSAFLTVGLVALYEPASVRELPELDVAYVGPGGFDVVLDEAGNLEVAQLDLPTALARFQEGSLFAVIEETYADAEGQRTVTLLLPEDELATTLVVNQLKDLLTEYERGLRLERQDRLEQEVLYVDSDADQAVYFDFAYSVLLPLLVATPVFLAGAITADSVAEEISTKSLALLRASPASMNEIVLGKLLVPVLLAPAQVLLWIGFLRLNGLPVANVGLVLLIAFALGLVLAGLSIVLAVQVRREGQVQAAYTVVVLVLALASLMLPRDPFNLIALTAVDLVDASVVATLGVYLFAGLACLTLGLWAANRQVRRDVV